MSDKKNLKKSKQHRSQKVIKSKKSKHITQVEQESTEYISESSSTLEKRIVHTPMESGITVVEDIAEKMLDSTEQSRSYPYQHELPLFGQAESSEVKVSVAPQNERSRKASAVVDKILPLFVSEVVGSESCKLEKFTHTVIEGNATETLLSHEGVERFDIPAMNTTEELSTKHKPDASKAEVHYTTFIAKTIDEKEIIEEEVELKDTACAEARSADISFSQSYSVEVLESNLLTAQSNLAGYNAPKLYSAEPNIEIHVPLDVTQVVSEQSVSGQSMDHSISATACRPTFVPQTAFGTAEVHASEKEQIFEIFEQKSEETARISFAKSESMTTHQVLATESEEQIVMRAEDKKTAFDSYVVHEPLQNEFIDSFDSNETETDFKYEQKTARKDFNTLVSRATCVTDAFETAGAFTSEISQTHNISKGGIDSLRARSTDIIDVNECEAKLALPKYDLEQAIESVNVESSVDVSDTLVFDTADWKIKQITQRANEQKIKVGMEPIHLSITEEKWALEKETVIDRMETLKVLSQAKLSAEQTRLGLAEHNFIDTLEATVDAPVFQLDSHQCKTLTSHYHNLGSQEEHVVFDTLQTLQKRTSTDCKAKVSEDLRKYVNIETILPIENASDASITTDTVLERPRIETVPRNALQIREDDPIESLSNLKADNVKTRRLIPFINENLERSIIVDESQGIEHASELFIERPTEDQLKHQSVIESAHVNTELCTPYESFSDRNIEIPQGISGRVNIMYQPNHSIVESTTTLLESTQEETKSEDIALGTNSLKISTDFNQSISTIDTVISEQLQRSIVEWNPIVTSIKSKISEENRGAASQLLIDSFENMAPIDAEKRDLHLANVTSENTHKVPEYFEVYSHGKEGIIFEGCEKRRATELISETEGNECSLSETTANFLLDLSKTQYTANISHREEVASTIQDNACLDKETIMGTQEHPKTQVGEMKLIGRDCTTINVETVSLDNVDAQSDFETDRHLRYAKPTTELVPMPAASWASAQKLECANVLEREMISNENKSSVNFEIFSHTLRVGHNESLESSTELQAKPQIQASHALVGIVKCYELPTKEQIFDMDSTEFTPEYKCEEEKARWTSDLMSQITVTETNSINSEETIKGKAIVREDETKNVLQIQEMVPCENMKSLEKQACRQSKVKISTIDDYLKDNRYNQINIQIHKQCDELIKTELETRNIRIKGM